MPFYLDTYVGAGTDTDPYRPAISDMQPAWAAIDLRPGGTGTPGRCVVRTAAAVSPLPSGTVLLSATIDGNVTGGVRAQMETRLGLPVGTLTNVPLKRLLLRVLVALARTDGTRWRPLMPLPDGGHEIHLGTRIAYAAGDPQ